MANEEATLADNTEDEKKNIPDIVVDSTNELSNSTNQSLANYCV